MSKAAQARAMDQVDRAAVAYAFFSPDDEKDRHVAKRFASAKKPVCVCRGVYARPSVWEAPGPDTRHIWLVRALQGRHPSLVFSGTTAAPVHGLSVSFNELDPPMRAVEQHGRTKHTGIVRRVETSASDAVIVDGIRVTQLLQTVFDCMRWMSFGEGLAVADSALCRGQTEKDQLIEYIRLASRRSTSACCASRHNSVATRTIREGCSRPMECHGLGSRLDSHHLVPPSECWLRPASATARKSGRKSTSKRRSRYS